MNDILSKIIAYGDARAREADGRRQWRDDPTAETALVAVQDALRELGENVAEASLIDLVTQMQALHGQWRYWDGTCTVFTSLPERAATRIAMLEAQLTASGEVANRVDQALGREMIARQQAEAELATIKAALENANSLCRSMNSILTQGITETNWPVFKKALEAGLKLQHAAMYPPIAKDVDA
ncbi:MAG: hypothetical protein E5V40_05800 [Mesorhizobium sp.]|nr:MAG: hypothetical protein E5V40_05800 [Mesorhizobium sp.]